MSEIDPCTTCEFNTLIEQVDQDNSWTPEQAEGCVTFIDTVKTVYNLEISCGIAAAYVLRDMGDESTRGLAKVTIEQIYDREKLKAKEIVLPEMDEAELITKRDINEVFGPYWRAGAILGNLKRIARSGKLPLVEAVTSKDISGITRESAATVLRLISEQGYDGPGLGVETQQALQSIIEKSDVSD